MSSPRAFAALTVSAAGLLLAEPGVGQRVPVREGQTVQVSNATEVLADGSAARLPGTLRGRVARVGFDTVWITRADGSRPRQIVMGPLTSVAPIPAGEDDPAGREVRFRLVSVGAANPGGGEPPWIEGVLGWVAHDSMLVMGGTVRDARWYARSELLRVEIARRTAERRAIGGLKSGAMLGAALGGLLGTAACGPPILRKGCTRFWITQTAGTALITAPFGLLYSIVRGPGWRPFVPWPSEPH